MRRQKYEAAVAFLKEVAAGQAAGGRRWWKTLSPRIFGRLPGLRPGWPGGLVGGGKAMTDFDWTALEEAVLSALQMQLAYRVDALESYQGDWRGRPSRGPRRLPAVLVMAGGHQVGGGPRCAPMI